ncbi:MAG: hypothetical protein FAZ92_02983 [Accumulibacter sp.]|nr:MAG: hypothetical protein FAZ92_02983 [Accumulibacter sp.]
MQTIDNIGMRAACLLLGGPPRNSPGGDGR